MFKTIVTRVMNVTPYRIERRKRSAEQYDAIEHNSLEGINRIFSDPKRLGSYVSEERKRQYGEVVRLIRDNGPLDSPDFGDFGCGPGDLLKLLSEAFPGGAYTGYDFADATLTAARQRFPEGIFVQHDLYQPPPRQHSIVTCTQTLEHLLEPQNALRTLIDATAPGGILVLTVPDGRVDRFRGHINFWSPESWSAWLARHSRHPFTTFRFPKKDTDAANLAALIRVA